MEIRDSRKERASLSEGELCDKLCKLVPWQCAYDIALAAKCDAGKIRVTKKTDIRMTRSPRNPILVSNIPIAECSAPENAINDNQPFDQIRLVPCV